MKRSLLFSITHLTFSFSFFSFLLDFPFNPLLLFSYFLFSIDQKFFFSSFFSFQEPRKKKEKTCHFVSLQMCLLSIHQTSKATKLDSLLHSSIKSSRTGGVKDSWKIDYEATKNSLIAGRKFGAQHFVLLSAICVQKPLLEFQRAKLKFEAELMKESENDNGFTYSIVRPTAFFKSLGGQIELVKDGKPYVMFGDGKLCACKPISEPDLASFIADCVLSEDKINQVLPIGGPGKALTPLEQGEMLFKLLGKEPKFLKVPIGIMDFAIGILDFLVQIFPSMEDAAEFGKIGRYYAAESMLILDPETGDYSAEKTPSYGKDTLEEFFERVLREGMAGQELGEQTIF
ncbi:divinyl chlorophyllide a 8-vinyl-reductase, chloroplastic isoform X2 [Ricinus communis]|uniref:Uncharacterized protein n=1 Tax=Ricinus communis TaxID=3988 RepID=B9RT02_RICCO|nr:divinyl chlorophyllide a 8-vinyl-reductase, chloroplastic isoform X2 [Ricinus communis]EEF45485.1 conserved hypothetical protein [Ricinus communis]